MISKQGTFDSKFIEAPQLNFPSAIYLILSATPKKTKIRCGAKNFRCGAKNNFAAPERVLMEQYAINDFYICKQVVRGALGD